jgi:hypothetical protein
MPREDGNGCIAAKFLFTDVWALAEVMFIGSPLMTDASVPFLDLNSPPESNGSGKRFLKEPVYGL